MMTMRAEEAKQLTQVAREIKYKPALEAYVARETGRAFEAIRARAELGHDNVSIAPHTDEIHALTGDIIEHVRVFDWLRDEGIVQIKKRLSDAGYTLQDDPYYARAFIVSW